MKVSKTGVLPIGFKEGETPVFNPVCPSCIVRVDSAVGSVVCLIVIIVSMRSDLSEVLLQCVPGRVVLPVIVRVL